MRTLLPIIALLLFAGCAATRYRYIDVPTGRLTHDTVLVTAVRADSVHVRDSIYVEGEKIYKERTVYKERTRTDTVWAVRTDSVRVPVPYPVEAERAKPSPIYDTACLWVGRGCVIAALLWAVFLYLRRRRQR